MFDGVTFLQCSDMSQNSVRHGFSRHSETILNPSNSALFISRSQGEMFPVRNEDETIPRHMQTSSPTNYHTDEYRGSRWCVK